MSLSRVGKGVDGWRVFGDDDDRHLVLDALMVVGPLERIMSYNGGGSHSMFILREYVVLKEMA